MSREPRSARHHAHDLTRGIDPDALGRVFQVVIDAVGPAPRRDRCDPVGPEA